MQLLTPTPHLGVPEIESSSTLMPMCTLRATGDGSSTWVPATHTGFPAETPSSGLTQLWLLQSSGNEVIYLTL